MSIDQQATPEQRDRLCAQRPHPAHPFRPRWRNFTEEVLDRGNSCHRDRISIRTLSRLNSNARVRLHYAYGRYLVVRNTTG